jgi:phage/plasmid-like protein (TIGR03299 family)
MSYRTSIRSLAKLPNYPGTIDALQASGMDWDVELEPLTTSGGRNAPARAVVRGDTRQPLGVVGLRYAPCSNRLATSWLDRYIPHGLRITGAEMFKGGQRCVMFGLLGNEPLEVKTGDQVALQVVVSWSHDGSSSTMATLRALRLVCSNGLVLASDAGRMFSIWHTVGAADPNNEQIQAKVREGLSRFDDSMERYRAIADRPATRDDVRNYTQRVMRFAQDEATGLLSARSANVLDTIVRKYEDATSQDDGIEGERSIVERMVENFDGAGVGQTINGGGTWWNAYNAITEHLTHDRGRSAEHRRESLLFGSAARINRRALDLALLMSGVD